MREFSLGPVRIEEKRDVWKGKKLFIDLDGTLVEAKEREKGTLIVPGAPSVTLREFGELITYDIHEVSRDAGEVVRFLRSRFAMPFITSIAERDYAESVLKAARLADDFDGIYSFEDFAGGRLSVARKDYRIPIADIGERDPLANCVAIGNEPSKDVSLEPAGMLSAIVKVGTSFREVAAVLEILLEIGNSNFAAGFDKAVSDGYLACGFALSREYGG